MTRREWLRRTFGGVVVAVCGPSAVTVPLRTTPLNFSEMHRITAATILPAIRTDYFSNGPLLQYLRSQAYRDARGSLP